MIVRYINVHLLLLLLLFGFVLLYVVEQEWEYTMRRQMQVYYSY